MPDAGSVHVDVLPDLRKFGPQLRAQLKRYAAEDGPRIAVGLDTTKATAELTAFSGKVKELDKTRAKVAVSADTRAALARITGVEAALERLDGKSATVTVKTDQRGGVTAPSGTGAGRSGGGRGGGGRPFTDISPAASAAIWTMAPAAVPAVGALTGAIAGLTSGLTAATAGMGAFAAAAVPAIVDVAEVFRLQEEAAQGGAEEMAAYQAALAALPPEARKVYDAWSRLTGVYREWQEGLQADTMPVVVRGINLLGQVLPSLTPIVRSSAAGFDSLLASSEKALAGEHWTRFTDFAARQAEPSIGILGRSVGNLAMGFTGLMVSFEPLWNRMGPGIEDLTRRFAAWANEGDNFTAFIDWTIQNGPIFLSTFGAIAGAAVDVGVALAPLGTVYAQGLGLLAEAIGWVADTAPWLLQVAVAAKTAQVAFSLLGRVNTGLIQPMRELPGHLSTMRDNLTGVGTAATTAGTATRGFGGAVSGAVGALGGPWGIAITAGIALLGAFVAAKANATAKTQEYTEAIKADSGALAENSRLVAVRNLENEGLLETAQQLGISTQLVTDAVLGQSGAYRELNATIDERMAKADKQYEQGELSTQQWNDQILPLTQLRDGIAAESAAVDESVAAHQRQVEAMGATSISTQGLTASMAAGTVQANSLKQSLDLLTGSNISAAQAEIGYKAAVDAATASVTQNGISTDLNTESGRANRTALINLATAANDHTAALRENGASADQVTAQTKKQREEFIKAARQMGYTKDEAEKLADEYLGIPKDVSTAIEVSARGSWSLIEGYEDKTKGRGSGYLGGLATGGPVRGPGTATSDSILARLSDGEYVQKASAVDYYGEPLMDALNQKRIPREALTSMPGFAKGGRVRTTAHRSKESPWSALADHTGTIKPEYRTLVNNLISAIGTRMAKQWAEYAGSGPNAVVRLAEASLGRYPEAGGNNVNAITRWYGMNGAPWCAMFISWLFAQTGNSRALGRASRTAWTGTTTPPGCGGCPTRCPVTWRCMGRGTST
ncbi:hypothetical protein ACFQXA_38085 [Nocardiopsis composta]